MIDVYCIDVYTYVALMHVCYISISMHVFWINFYIHKNIYYIDLCKYVALMYEYCINVCMYH